MTGAVWHGNSPGRWRAAIARHDPEEVRLSGEHVRSHRQRHRRKVQASGFRRWGMVGAALCWSAASVGLSASNSATVRACRARSIGPVAPNNSVVRVSRLAAMVTSHVAGNTANNRATNAPRLGRGRY